MSFLNKIKNFQIIIALALLASPDLSSSPESISQVEILKGHHERTLYQITQLLDSSPESAEALDHISKLSDHLEKIEQQICVAEKVEPEYEALNENAGENKDLTKQAIEILYDENIQKIFVSAMGICGVPIIGFLSHKSPYKSESKQESNNIGTLERAFSVASKIHKGYTAGKNALNETDIASPKTESVIDIDTNITQNLSQKALNVAKAAFLG